MEKTLDTGVGFDEWCLLEIMGHQRYAGRVTEQTIGGSAMLRLDVPKTKSQPGFTKFFNGSSVYAISPMTEELARGLAEKLGHAPVERYDFPDTFFAKLRRASPLGLPEHPIDEDDIDERDDDDEPF